MTLSSYAGTFRGALGLRKPPLILSGKGAPGKKLLFKGNHDLWWSSAGKLNKLYGDEKMIFLQNDAALIEGDGGKKIAVCGSRGWICPGSEGFTAEDDRLYRRELLRLEMSLKEGKELKADEIIGALIFRQPTINSRLRDSHIC